MRNEKYCLKDIRTHLIRSLPWLVLGFRNHDFFSNTITSNSEGRHKKTKQKYGTFFSTNLYALLYKEVYSLTHKLKFLETASRKKQVMLYI